MKRLVRPLALLGMGFLAIYGLSKVVESQEAEPAQVAAVITFVKGKVVVVRPGGGEPVRAKKGEFLNEGDIVRTGPKEKAAVAFMEGAEVRINENTEFEVSRQGGPKKERKVFLPKGQVWTRLLHHNAEFAIRTTAAVAAVRGTEADVEMSNLMTVKVYEGTVDLMNKAGSTALTAGQMSQAGGQGSAPAPAKQMSQGDYGKWQQGMRIKNIEELLKQLQNQGGSGEKKLKIQIEKDGQQKEVELKFKKK
ncbi:MAG: FecR domain-containing protein [Elusimicrobia bacterium]|nr:FecR domain-containing protein [Elusimicrobiota bacterium]